MQLILFIITILHFLATASPTAEIQVTSLADTIANDGRCTLREAVHAANTDTAVDACPAGSPTEQDMITFAVEGTIFLDTPLLLGGNLTIQGNGPKRTLLDGQGSSRVLQVGENGKGRIVLRGLTIQNGRAAYGAALNGLNAPCDATITIEDSLFQDNSAENDGGAVLAGCGSWSISGSTFTGNQAANGGGMAILTPPGETGDTQVSINNSTFSANDEGALFAQRWGNSQSELLIQVRNSTLINDGRYNIELASENEQSRIEAIFNDTILANRSGPNCFRVHPINVPTPIFASEGYNLFDSSSCGFNAIGDRLVSSFELKYTLGKLEDNGGPTPTHALLPGHPAIDNGSCSNGQISIDQRGISRPQGSACDTGAFEYQLIEKIYLPNIHYAE